MCVFNGFLKSSANILLKICKQSHTKLFQQVIESIEWCSTDANLCGFVSRQFRFPPHSLSPFYNKRSNSTNHKCKWVCILYFGVNGLTAKHICLKVFYSLQYTICYYLISLLISFKFIYLFHVKNSGCITSTYFYLS